MRSQRPDALGYLLVIALHVPLAWRRRSPQRALLALMVLAVPFFLLTANLSF